MTELGSWELNSSSVELENPWVWGINENSFASIFSDMKRILMCILWLFALFSAISSGLSNSEISQTSVSDLNREQVNVLKHSPTNSLLPITPKHSTVLVAALDGTIYLVEIQSRKILWSFPSGTSIYSSYQALPDHDSDNHNASELHDYFIDCGDDWGLYMHGPGYKKVKLPLSAEELIKSTPVISADGGIMLGSKNTTVFLVNAKSGKVIHTFSSTDHSAIGIHGAEGKPIVPRKDVEEWVQSGAVDLEQVEHTLFVIRTDYALKYFSQKTGKELWHLRFAEIEASFGCQEADNFFGDVSKPEDNFGPELKDDDDLALNCQTRTVVYRIRDHSLLEALFMSDRIPSVHLGGRVPSLSTPDLNPLVRPLDLLSGEHQNEEGKVVLALPAPDPNPLVRPHDLLSREHQNKESKVVLALPAPENEDFGILSLDRRDADKIYATVAPEVFAGSHMWYFFVFVFLLCFIVFLFNVGASVIGAKFKLNNQSKEGKVQAVMSKKKKARKLGINKNSSGVDTSRKDVSHENMVGDTNGVPEHLCIEKTGRKSLLTSLNPIHGGLDGRSIGKLFVTNKEIAKGSNGTIVLEGIYDGRPVAVKRLVRTHHDVALKEIQNLIASDYHTNIVRWYGVEYDQDFVYLSLERCTCSLDDLIFSYAITSQNQIINKNQDPNFLNGFTIQLHSAVEKNKDFGLWKANGHPSAQLLKLMRDIVSGLGHLHEVGIIHRDLKPPNVLIIKERSLCAKLSDMGISKRLSGNMSSLTQNATGCGSSGWQSPEQLRHGRQTRAVDLFSLGCVLFFCLTGGQHPFGDSFERDVNIVNNRKDLFLVEHIPEAIDLISSLLDPEPNLRPKAVDVLNHPLFWNAETRLSFLRDVSDRVELEDRESESEILEALERIAPVALGGKWDEKMETAFINDIGRYRRYKFDSVRDLLRVIRNKLNHYRELSQEIQGILGQIPEGFDSYFSSRFPHLLIEVYKVIHTFCREEEFLRKYFRSTQS